jgi:hypothetical protein
MGAGAPSAGGGALTSTVPGTYSGSETHAPGAPVLSTRNHVPAREATTLSASDHHPSGSVADWASVGSLTTSPLALTLRA